MNPEVVELCVGFPPRESYCDREVYPVVWERGRNPSPHPDIPPRAPYTVLVVADLLYIYIIYIYRFGGTKHIKIFNKNQIFIKHSYQISKKIIA